MQTFVLMTRMFNFFATIQMCERGDLSEHVVEVYLRQH